MSSLMNGSIEIEPIFNTKCICFGIEFYWGSEKIIEILFFRWNITINL